MPELETMHPTPNPGPLPPADPNPPRWALAVKAEHEADNHRHCTHSDYELDLWRRIDEYNSLEK